MRRLDLSFLAMSLVTFVVAFLILFPLAMLIYGSFWTERPGFSGNFTLDNYITAYGDADTYKVFLNTALLIGAKTICAGVIALALAWIIARTDTPCRVMLETLIIMPFFVPGIMEAVGWIMLLSPKTGTLNVFLREVMGLEKSPFNIY